MNTLSTVINSFNAVDKVQFWLKIREHCSGVWERECPDEVKEIIALAHPYRTEKYLPKEVLNLIWSYAFHSFDYYLDKYYKPAHDIQLFKGCNMSYFAEHDNPFDQLGRYQFKMKNILGRVRKTLQTEKYSHCISLINGGWWDIAVKDTDKFDRNDHEWGAQTKMKELKIKFNHNCKNYGDRPSVVWLEVYSLYYDKLIGIVTIPKKYYSKLYRVADNKKKKGYENYYHNSLFNVINEMMYKGQFNINCDYLNSCGDEWSTYDVEHVKWIKLGYGRNKGKPNPFKIRYLEGNKVCLKEYNENN